MSKSQQTETSSNEQNDSAETFQAWKTWIEDKAAWLLSYAVDEKYAKEVVTTISNYVVDYVYPNERTDQSTQNKEDLIERLSKEMPTSVVEHENFQGLIEALQTPPQGDLSAITNAPSVEQHEKPLLLTNFPANPEKYAMQAIESGAALEAEKTQSPAVIASETAASQVNHEELVRDILTNIVEKAIDLSQQNTPPLLEKHTKSDTYIRKANIFPKGEEFKSKETEKELFKRFQEERRKSHPDPLKEIEAQTKEENERNARLSEYKSTQAKEFAPWSSLSPEVQKDLKEIEKAKLEDAQDLKKQQLSPSTIKVEDSELSFSATYSHDDKFSGINPMRQPKADRVATSTTLKSGFDTATKSSELAPEIHAAPKVVVVEKPTILQGEPTQVLIPEQQAARKANSTSIAAPTNYTANPFQFLPKKPQGQAATQQDKPLPKWKIAHMENLAKQASVPNISISSGSQKELTSSPTVSVQDRINKFGGGKTRH